jgi:hypothetical protein
VQAKLTVRLRLLKPLSVLLLLDGPSPLLTAYVAVLDAAGHVLINYDRLLLGALRCLRLCVSGNADHSGVIIRVNEHLRAVDDVLV